ncbi:unnamed protein product [Caenorhabditis angaria]|uniref:Leucine-rich PPR motif-containing protein, mitochondrial n=1 Tax=Caenorhabditis angaria TaxID=860376 RepID=A0A9P1IVT1_9PELO|nr:unnamed protein product [Caenorhabditis angaria]
MLRNGLRLARGRRQFSAAVQATNTPANSVPPPPTSQGEIRKKRNFVSSTPVEQIRLEKKYQEHLKNNKLETLHEAVEYVEWRGTVYPQTMRKQLAVLLSVFGANCDTVSKKIRAAHLEKVEVILAHKNVQLGLASRNALIECKIDNGTRVDVVEELSKYEENGIEVDSKGYALLCEVYAKQGNTKAITDIIQHMKSQSIPLAEDHIVQLVYSVAKSGNDAQVGKVVEKFANSMNVVRLRCAAARAIIQREKEQTGKGGFEVTEMLRNIPTTAKVHSVDNNKYVLNVFMDLIEVGQLDAFNLISSYLVLSEDNIHLAENFQNTTVVARCKSLLSDGNIVEAITLYSRVPPSFSNEFFTKTLKETLENQLVNIEPSKFNDFLKLLTLAHKNGLIESVDQFLLSTISHQKVAQFKTVFDYCEKSGSLRNFLFENGGLKRKLAKKVANLLIATNEEKEKAEYLGKIASVLFSPSKDETVPQIYAFYPIIYQLSNRDVQLVIPALETMNGKTEKREFSTAIVDQLLRSIGNDHVAIEKLQKLLDSNKIDQLNVFRIHKSLIRNITSGKISMKTVAKILSLDFPSADSHNSLKYTAVNLAKFLSNEIITDEKAEEIIGYLESDTRATLSTEEVFAARDILKGQPKKAELIGNLKRSQTLTKWRNTDVEQLIEEVPRVKKPAAKLALIDVVVYKTLKEKSNDLSFIVNILENSVEWKTLMNENEEYHNKRIRANLRNLETIAISKAISTNDMVLADRLWMTRSGHLTADVCLAYASRLFVNGQVERADEVCEDLRVSSQLIRAVTLEKTGRRLKGVSSEKMNELAKYLSKQFNLSQKDTRRIVQQVKLEELNSLIQSGKLNEALQMAIEETEQSRRAFGQVPIMIEAIKKDNLEVLSSVHMMVRSAHNQDMANINLAYALIHSDNAERARVLVEKQNLEIEDFTLQYFITLASSSESPKTLKNLFLIFNGRASTLQLNSLLETATKQLWKSGDIESLNELDKEIASSNFPLQNRLRAFFDDLKVKHAENLIENNDGITNI